MQGSLALSSLALVLSINSFSGVFGISQKVGAAAQFGPSADEMVYADREWGWLKKTGHAMNSRPGRVYFAFGSIPPHSFRVETVLRMMQNQTLVPDAVILTVAKKYLRFNESFPLDRLPKDDMLKVNLIDTDYGSISKYNAHSMLDDQDILVVGDDDMDYGSMFIEDMVSAFEDNSTQEVIFSGHYDSTFDGIMAYAGISCRAGTLKNLPMSVPDDCLLADDVVISRYAQVHNIRKGLLVTRGTGFTDSELSHDATSISAFQKGTDAKSQTGSVNIKCLRALEQMVWT